MPCGPPCWPCACWYSQGGKGFCLCSSQTPSLVRLPTPSWHHLYAVCASPCSLREGWRWLPWTQTVLGVAQGVQHPLGMMSQHCLPPGCPGLQPRCWAGCLRSPYLKEMTGDTMVLRHYPFVILSCPWQQPGDPYERKRGFGECWLLGWSGWGLPGMNPSMSQISGAGSTRIYPRPCLKQDFPWCCPHLLRLYICLLSRLFVLGHLSGLTA